MACDSLYVAWLKVHYPYELYATMLKLYDKKKNVDKISAIISEMKRYKNIDFQPGGWGQNNRDWLVDKQNHVIHQSLSSIKYMSPTVAEELYNLSQQSEAEVGVEFIPAKLNKAGKDEIKKLKQIAKQAESDYSSGKITQDSVGEIADELELKSKEIWETDAFLETKGQEIHHKVKLDCFTNVLRAIQMNTCLDTRQIKILLDLGYFSQFGGSLKLTKVYNEFFEGKNKLTKTIKSFMARLESVRAFEEAAADEELPLQMKLISEQENVGLCLSTDPSQARSVYFIRMLDEKWGTNAVLYSLSTGNSGNVRFRKADIQKKPIAVNQIIQILDGNFSQRYTMKDGKREPIPGEKEYWVRKYNILRPAGA